MQCLPLDPLRRVPTVRCLAVRCINKEFQNLADSRRQLDFIAAFVDATDQQATDLALERGLQIARCQIMQY